MPRWPKAFKTKWCIFFRPAHSVRRCLMVIVYNARTAVHLEIQFITLAIWRNGRRALDEHWTSIERALGQHQMSSGTASDATVGRQSPSIGQEATTRIGQVFCNRQEERALNDADLVCMYTCSQWKTHRESHWASHWRGSRMLADMKCVHKWKMLKCFLRQRHNKATSSRHRWRPTRQRSLKIASESLSVRKFRCLKSSQIRRR